MARKATDNPFGSCPFPAAARSPILAGLRNLRRLRYRAALNPEPNDPRARAARRFLERRLLGLSVVLREELRKHPGWGEADSSFPSGENAAPPVPSTLRPRRLGAFALHEIEEIRQHLLRAGKEGELEKVEAFLLREERLLEEMFRLGD